MLRETFTTVPQICPFSQCLRRTVIQSNYSSSPCSLSNHSYYICFTPFFSLSNFPFSTHLFLPSFSLLNNSFQPLFCQHSKFFKLFYFWFTLVQKTLILEWTEISIIFIPTIRLLSIIVEIVYITRYNAITACFQPISVRSQYHSGFIMIYYVLTVSNDDFKLSPFLKPPGFSDNLTFCR